jgi:hypothetical protein
VTSLRKLERDYIKANISEVTALLERVGDRDVMSRFGLEDQLNELNEALARLEAMSPETLASAALFFGGGPVLGSQGIESGFAGSAVGQFQDLVSMVHAHETVGLAERGTVPRRASSTLHITNIVRGSFGFLLEEVQPQLQIVDSSLKTAVDEATRLLKAFGEDDEEQFRSAVEEIDQRVLATTGEFFDLMRKSGAATPTGVSVRTSSRERSSAPGRRRSSKTTRPSVDSSRACYRSRTSLNSGPPTSGARSAARWTATSPLISWVSSTRNTSTQIPAPGSRSNAYCATRRSCERDTRSSASSPMPTDAQAQSHHSTRPRRSQKCDRQPV